MREKIGVYGTGTIGSGQVTLTIGNGYETVVIGHSKSGQERCRQAVARNWDITAGLKWIIQTAQYHKNPILINVGACYKF